MNKAKIIVSGSSSKLISKDYGTLLTGRHLNLTIYPLGFIEFLAFKNQPIRSALELIEYKLQIRNLLDEYLNFGGFPEVVLATDGITKTRLLEMYFDDIKSTVAEKRLKLDHIIQIYMNLS